ncbi:DUF6531 domain-containing protein [Sorangium sp. So ce233]|uniref:DUF6531 domain-containing protein n=1 Tax=Sorangium sp. So ce233 TaxID=3133290 RepID=UPI003F5DF06B
MAHNFHDINGWLIVGLEMHQGFHIFPPAPMKFLKLVLLHPFTLGDRQKPTVLFNGVPSVTHQHEPKFLWPHLGIVPDPLDALTPLHILFGSQKCWLPRGAVEICGEKATCCVIGGPISLNADCWDIGRWPSSLVLNPGTVQTTPTFGDFAMGAVTLAIDLVLDLLFEGAAKLAGGLLLKLGGKVLKPLFKKAKDLIGKGLKAATRQMGRAGKALGKGARALKGRAASALKKAKCFVTGHPVDATSGAVVDSKVDISLPGAIPLVWERHYSSARALDRTSLGRGGWVHSLEQWVESDEERITLRDEQGRDIYFPRVGAGESAFHRPDRLTLRAEQGGGFSVHSHASRLTRHYAPVAPLGRALLRSITDPHGNAITLEYTGERLHRVVDTAGREVRVKATHGGRIARLEVWAEGILEQWVDYAYAKMGELSSAADALGHVEHYGYDEDHRMVKTTLKNGVSFYYAYDPETGWCKKTWGDGGLHTVELRVDLEQRITWLTGNEEPRTLTWNEDGLVVREETVDGRLIRAREYDPDQYLLAETNGVGEGKRYAYDARGNRIREVDQAGNIAEWDYREDLLVTHVSHEGLVTEYEHDALGALVAVTQPSRLRHTLSYDRRGRPLELSSEEGRLAAFSFDIRHNLIEEIDARGAKTRYEYDRMGRPLQRVDALGRVTAVAYDRLGRLVSLRRPDGTTTSSEYDALGNAVRVADASWQVTQMEYAGTGVLHKIVEPNGRTWRLRYTPGEKLRSVENARGELHEFVYDHAGRITSEQTFDGRVLKYAYSGGGALARIDYPDHSFRALEYDPLGNVVREDSSDGSITLQRDRYGRLLGGILEQDGRRAVTTFERDRLGRVIASVHDGRRTVYENDARGRRTARALPDGAATGYRYNTRGDLVGVSHDGHDLSIGRDVLGREELRKDGAGRFSIQSAYDSMDRMIEQRVDAQTPGSRAPSLVARRLWQYDPLGRVNLVEDERWGATRYRYDAAGQLLESRRGALRELFAYDAAGAIRSILRGLEVEPGAEEEAWLVGKGNQLLRSSQASYTYDQRGRRCLKIEGAGGTSSKRTEYAWDCRDRLREVKLPSGDRVVFAYDAFGRRVRKELLDEQGIPQHTVDFIWDGDVLAADVDSRHGTRHFVHAPGTFVMLLQAEQGEVLSYVNDQVGVPKELVDAQGKIAWAASHTPWGSVAETHVPPERAARGARPVESPFRLLGQYADEETGLCHARFRYFDPDVGRWCSPDPLGLAGGNDPNGWDINPINWVDPLGLFLELPADPNELLNKGWQDVTHPEMAKHSNRREFYNPDLGYKVAFDKGVPGAAGWEAVDHYHVYNPNATSKGDQYLDETGKPVPKGSKQSHIKPNC